MGLFHRNWVSLDKNKDPSLLHCYIQTDILVTWNFEMSQVVHYHSHSVDSTTPASGMAQGTVHHS